MLAGTCVVACGTAGEETGWVEAFEGALWEGGGCAVGGLSECGGGEEEDGEEEGEMGGEDGHFFFVVFLGLGGFLGDDECGNVGVGGIVYEVERMCAGCFTFFMLQRGYIYGLRIARILSL